jgi:hypothetical protein
LFAALLVLGCGARKTTLNTLKAGDRVALSVSPAGGALAADAVLAEESAGEDPAGDLGVDCQNGLDPKGQPCDGGPDANKDDGSAEDAEPAALPAGQVVVPRGMLQPSGQDFMALGMELVASTRPPEGAAVRFVGALDARGRFVAASARASRSRTARLVGRLQSVSRDASGLTLKVLGQTVRAKGDVPFGVVTSVEAAAESDADGVTCEQNGQSEGDNSGC